MTNRIRALSLALACCLTTASGGAGHRPPPPRTSRLARGASLPTRRRPPRRAGRFFPNLGRNVVGMFGRAQPEATPDRRRGHGLGYALRRQRLKRYFGEERRGRVARRIRPAASAALSSWRPRTLALYGLGRVAPQSRFRDCTYDLAQAFARDAVYTTAIKLPAHRLRPDGSDHLLVPLGPHLERVRLGDRRERITTAPRSASRPIACAGPDRRRAHREERPLPLRRRGRRHPGRAVVGRTVRAPRRRARAGRPRMPVAHCIRLGRASGSPRVEL